MSLLIWAIPIAFLIGSIPFGFIIARAHGIDIRTKGSGNIGATNVARVLGPRAGAICFALDIAKGFAPTLTTGIAAGLIGPSTDPAAPAHPDSAQVWLWLAVMAAPVLGHMFSPWIGFKGGKGVATALGALLGVWPVLTIAALGAAAVWIITATLFRYVGLASSLAALTLPWWAAASLYYQHNLNESAKPYLIITGLLALLVVLKHRGNLMRTIQGTEPKIGRSSKPKAPKTDSPSSKSP